MKAKWLILVFVLSVYGSIQLLKKSEYCRGVVVAAPRPSPADFPDPLFLLNL
jgi:hypothetical protein